MHAMAARRGLRSVLLGGVGVAGIFAIAAPARADDFFVPGDLVVSSSTYEGSASTVTVGQTLPSGAIATNNGVYPGVFNNDIADASFPRRQFVLISRDGGSTGAQISRLSCAIVHVDAPKLDVNARRVLQAQPREPICNRPCRSARAGPFLARPPLWGSCSAPATVEGTR